MTFVEFLSDEICLDQTEPPLVIALNATKPMRFVLRINKDETPATIGSEAICPKSSASHVKLKSDGLLRPNWGKSDRRDRPMSGVDYDFMYAGRDKSIKMTAGYTYDKKAGNSSKPKKGQGNRTKGRSLGAVLKLPRKNRSREHGSDLSTNHIVPGVMKVFGVGISADANYKSVKVTNASDANSIVKQVLGKYKLDSADAAEFVLCDVVGHFQKVSGGSGKNKDSKMQWITEYARVVGDGERPLVLQSLWQPSGNRSRRFELHRRETVVDGPANSTTSNGVARKKATIANQPPDLALLKEKLSISSTSECSESGTFDSHQRPGLDDGSVSHSDLTFNMTTAVDVPYLLLLRGCGLVEDYLLHRLDEDHMIIGRPTIGQKHPDIPLYSDDLITKHCQVFKKLPADNESVTESEDGLDQVFLEPFPNCEVMVNGRTLAEAVMLAPGDLVQIGRHYVFLYKDPMRVSDANLTFDWLPGAAVNGSGSLHGKAKVIRMQQVAAKSPNRLSLAYELEDEDKLLEYFVTICEPQRDEAFELVASYLFILAIEYSACNYTDVDTRRLILKVTNVIQAVAWVS